MALKRKISKEDHGKLDDATKALYKASGEDFVLDLDGEDPEVAAAKAKVNEFRDTNKALQKKLDEASKGNPKDATLADKFHELSTKFEQSEAERAKLAAAENDRRFEDTIRTAGKKMGLNQDAVPDMARRAKDAGFQIKEGAAVCLDSDGHTVSSKRTEGAPLTISEWLGDQREGGASFMFQRSSGAGGSKGKGTGDGIPAGARVVYDPSPEFYQQNWQDIRDKKIVVRNAADTA